MDSIWLSSPATRLGLASTVSAWSLLATLALAAPPLPVGEELILPQPPESCQHFEPVAAIAPNGGIMAAWLARGFGTVARTFSPGGLVPGDELPLGPTRSKIAAARDSTFVVVSIHSGQSTETLELEQLDGSGQPLTLPVRLAAAPEIRSHALAARPQGDVLVAWSESDTNEGDTTQRRLKLGRFDSAGRPLDEPTVVASVQSSGRPFFELQLVVTRSGGWLVLWTSVEAGDTWESARAYDPKGRPRAEAIQVNAPTRSARFFTATVLDGERFLYGWLRHEMQPGVYVQRADASGAPTNAPSRVDDPSGLYVRKPTLTTDAVGRPIVAWLSLGADDISINAWARILAADGQPAEPPFRINQPVEETFGSSRYSVTDTSIASGPNGQLIGLWQVSFYPGVDPPPPCSAGLTVMARQFRTLAFSLDNR
ncbi:MAG: hypothetical protein AAF560_01755 [Acidobacteriota bacterium]